MKIVIIEDELITARDLTKTIESIDADYHVVRMLQSVEESMAYFATSPDVDLIFSDIQLGDGLSFDIFRQTAHPIPIIFCTAYNAYYAEAFQSTGIDYLLKPFTKQSVKAALDKYQVLKAGFQLKKDRYSTLLHLLESGIAPRRNAIIVRHREKIIPISSDNIAVLYIENGYTNAFTFDLEKYVVTETLEELETLLAPVFFRANRQFLLNRKAIKDASQFFHRKMVVNLNIPFKPEIVVGKLKTGAFIEWLAQ